MMFPLPFITIVMPVRNEATFIAFTLRSLLSQDYPHEQFEILVVDGGSDDGTQTIVQRIASADGRVQLLNNPRGLSAAGRNIGFRQGKGDVFLVIDGHCHIPSADLLSETARCFSESGAHCLGRPQPLDPPGLTPFQHAVALARASRIGHAGNSLIYGQHEGFASPQSNGAAYRREVFDHVGFVDESFDACEDVEFNYRVERAGLTCYTSPRLTVRYYPRESLLDLLRQMRRYGYGRWRLFCKHPRTLGVQTLVPPAFFLEVCLLLASLLVSIAGGPIAPAVLLAMLMAAYIALVLGQSTAIACVHGWRHLLWLPTILFTIHFGLGMGFVTGMVRTALARLRALYPVHPAEANQ
ncbi:glycosyltransferase family 2 protein [Oceanidesulfovibrio marinus]|uniref:Glycosyltransferase family 2 protein n=1 Tax=Oceanidesulfovibrio marinus TaxID=370038 RepID=A0ABX6NC77_9BACT|nr:glycosyltransferase family 2 protein [Oceanidesulfovibrio marinus]QJT07956.1 glycosyltransferase family 2 protein [Oceanidesulfovibrio marinus]